MLQNSVFPPPAEGNRFHHIPAVLLMSVFMRRMELKVFSGVAIWPLLVTVLSYLTQHLALTNQHLHFDFTMHVCVCCDYMITELDISFEVYHSQTNY